MSSLQLKFRDRLKTYKGKSVLVTGHTGFKGSWLVRWLELLGARVTGFSLSDAPSAPSHYELIIQSAEGSSVQDLRGDIRDEKALQVAFEKSQPEIVFHLAAQPLVRRSYRSPIETYDVNVMGTLKVLEACRKYSPQSIKAVVNITSDKCYENREWIWPYRENDPMGGYDPYSSSKGCAELLTASYRRSFLSSDADAPTLPVYRLASVRAGNVIGGGDFAEDRLIPDVVRAVMRGESVEIRSPQAVRPWQHVLEPLAGYLLLGERLLNADESSLSTYADGWNFGPSEQGCQSVEQVLLELAKTWPSVKWTKPKMASPVHEAQLLRLDSSKANSILNWKPRLGFAQSLEWTAKWYMNFHELQKKVTGRELGLGLQVLTDQQIHEYMRLDQ